MDVITAFLNPKMDRNDLFMSLPEGIEWLDPSLPDEWKAVRVLKALYGLKQAPRLWYDEINSFLLSVKLVQSKKDPNLYRTECASSIIRR